MFKNTAGQKWSVLAFDRTTGERKTGDAAQISAKIAIDDGAATALGDAAPAEVEDGIYRFDLTQAETAGDKLELFSESSTSNVIVLGLPVVAYTRTAAPTAAEIRTEMDSNSTQLAAIVEDTGSTLPTAAEIRAEMDSYSFKLDLILDDTGTTLDNKLDSILEDTGTTLSTDIAGVRAVVDSVLVDTGTTLPATLTTMQTSITTVDTVVDAIRVDTGTDLPATLTTLQTSVTTVDDYVDTEVAAIKAISDKIDATLESSGGSYRFTTAALAQSHAAPTISQVIVPDSRTFELQRDSTGGLTSGGLHKVMQVGESLLWAADFKRELGSGDWITTITSIAIDTGAAGGVTFSAGDQGVNLAQVKFSTTAVTAGDYIIRVKCVTNNGDALEGDVRVRVKAA